MASTDTLIKFPLAKIALVDYLWRNGKSIDEIDPDKIFDELASRGDIESFRQLVEYYNSIDPDRQINWNPIRSLGKAGLHNQWDMIKFIVELDPNDENAPENYSDMVEEAIEGGHLDILKRCKEHPRLNYLIDDLDIELMQYSITRGRYAILNFLLEQHLESEEIDYILDSLAYIIYLNVDPNALENVFTHFPQFRAYLSDFLRNYLDEKFGCRRFSRPSTGLSSSEEFMPDDILRANLYKLKNMIA